MHASAIFTLALATLASSAAVASPGSPSNIIEARFDGSVMDNSKLAARSELVARACNCGAAFSCSGSVNDCCSSTNGFGMCNTDNNRCMCGTECNPLQCSQRP